MTIISSQRYIDSDIVDSKLAALEADRPAEVVLPVWPVGMDDLYVLSNGHHTLTAARALGIPVRFSVESHPERLTGQDLLEQAWIDADWYDIETGIPVF